ncbi:hypothetical protein SAMN02745207_02287 [Clostridium grantii DSM 8605]|uniref:Uncharacterized protein n=1 Tax=Clostridium grantii DSM 8605 TaxID=1121316 RepID=A0A1M5VH32_9CLOT|nr:hypothetical protein SAMN02745207_02287 [Clostridium grantii DSM 8605]
MKLKTGIYEQLINKSISEEIKKNIFTIFVKGLAVRQDRSQCITGGNPVW